jgi:UDP-N-acetylglucosamine transferase subunit ALG13
MDSTLSWKEHIKHTTSKLSSASYAIRILTSVMSLESLLITYYAYTHIIMSYGRGFWGNSTHSDQIFKIKKIIVKIIMKMGNRDSCPHLFKALNILPFYSQYLIL